MTFPDFDILPKGVISSAFIQKDIHSFYEACELIRKLPYARNTNKQNLLQLFLDNCGTCSTKHAVLKALAYENNVESIQLMIGIFKMNGNNTPKVKRVLEQYHLTYIPEAHCYLKYHQQVLDFTKINSKPSDFVNDLLVEIAIQAQQIDHFKVNYHKNYLREWLAQNSKINYSLDEIWAIRETCIQALSD